MKLFSSKKGEKKGSSEFSQFFWNASSADRKKVFKKAADKANEDQREVFYKNKPETKDKKPA